MTLKVYDPFAEKSIKRQANEREAKQAKQFGARKHLNSGAGDEKGDYSTDDFVFDSKHGLILSLNKMLVKLTKDTRATGKTPVILYTSNQFPKGVEDSWSVLPTSKFMDMIK